MALSNISEKEINKNMARLSRFLEACSYQIDDDRIIIYINELKKQFKPETVRKHIITIKRFLKFISYPSAELIKAPKIPKKLKLVLKPQDVRNLIEEIDTKVDYEPLRLRAKAAVLLSATSGLRAEEVYKLKRDDIDIDERSVHVRAEITKDFEERITFFTQEAKEVLEEWMAICKRDKLFFNLRDAFEKLNSPIKLKHMRKFFSQQSDRLGMPTAVKKILMGHSLRGDVDLTHYDFQDEEELKKIYDKYWKDFRIVCP